MNLYEIHRPKTLNTVLGQPKAVKTIARLQAHGLGGRALWISGASGTGKTTIARIVADSIADDMYIQEFDSADQLSVSALDKIESDMFYRAFGKGGKCYIVNEAHGLRKSTVRRLLGILEQYPNTLCLSSRQPNKDRKSYLTITSMQIHYCQDVLKSN